MLVILGLILGSFIAALTWRMPRGVSISNGRSFCPNCRKKISWFDNIPLLSFFLLGGKCRNCKEKISARYPLIEFSTAFLFGLVYVYFDNVLRNVPWMEQLPRIVALGLTLILVCALIAIFIVDIEHMLIPDEFVFGGLLVIVFGLLFANTPLYLNLFVGFSLGVFFLILNFITRGQGMGLGDAKFVLLVGATLGAQAVTSVLISFIVGALVGITLLILRQAKLQQKIAFGPFLVVGFLGSILFAHEIFWFF